VLLVRLRGGMDAGSTAKGSCSSVGGCDNISGSAAVHRERRGLPLQPRGRGALLAEHQRRAHHAGPGRRPDRLPFPVYFDGRWHGPVLRAASADHAVTEVFTARGALRTVTSTADTGTAQASLRYGSVRQFEAACAGLAR
jgi:hypothetical protein